MPETITRASVGQDVDLVIAVDGGIDGEPADFTITDPDGATVAMLTGAVDGGATRVPWKVDVGARTTPIDLRFTASVRGAKTGSAVLTVDESVVVHAIAWVEPGGASAADGRIEAAAGATTPAVPMPAAPLLGVGEVARLWIEVGAPGGGPVSRPFTLTIERRDVTGGGNEVLDRRHLSRGPGGGARVVLYDWIAEHSGDPAFQRVQFTAVPGGAASAGAAEGAPAGGAESRLGFADGDSSDSSGGGSGGSGSPGGAPTATAVVKKEVTITFVEHPVDVETAAKESADRPMPGNLIHKAWAGEVMRVSSAVTRVERYYGLGAGSRGTRGAEVDAPAMDLELRSGGPNAHYIRWLCKPATVAADAGSSSHQFFGRNRFSLWADSANVVSANFTSYPTGVIDDISLLATIQPKETVAGASETSLDLTPTWAAGQTGSKSTFAPLIRLCHSKKLQILAGFGLVGTKPPADLSRESEADRKLRALKDARNTRLAAWLNQIGALLKTSNADDAKAAEDAARKVATAFVGFLDQEFPPPDCFDGISFDVEDFGSFAGVWAPMNSLAKPSVIDPIRKALRLFYHAFARELAKTNRLCTVACGGMVDDDHSTSGNLALANGRLHTYDLPFGAPNLILRPMAYDNAGGEENDRSSANFDPTRPAHHSAYNSDGPSGQLDWHTAIIKFALDTKRIHPAQFQLGIKNFVPPNKSGQGGVVSSKDRLKTRCDGILRRHRVGLIFFALISPPRPPDSSRLGDKGSLGESWTRNEELDLALNKDPDGKAIRGPQVGQPLHAPLDLATLNRMK